MLQVKYVVMPITVEQKKEYHRQGFRVIDARFAPADAVIETHADGVERTATLGPEDGIPAPEAEKPARRSRRAKAEE